MWNLIIFCDVLPLNPILEYGQIPVSGFLITLGFTNLVYQNHTHFYLKVSKKNNHLYWKENMLDTYLLYYW